MAASTADDGNCASVEIRASVVRVAGHTSLVAGELWDHIGHVTVFYCGAAFAVVGALALWLLIPQIHVTRRVV
jgi:hypothetical protein